MAYTDIDDSSSTFQNKTYSGNGSTNNITLDGNSNLSPGLVWIKSRNQSGYNHCATDVVRGATKIIRPNLTNDEDTYANSLTSFNSNGFTLGSDSSNGEQNLSGESYISYNWKAGGSASSNSNGSITSSVSVDTTAGFSIGTFTGNATAGATIGHGLGAAPAWILCRTISAAKDWCVYHHKNTSAPQTEVLILNENSATTDTNDRWNDTLPGSSTFTIGDSSQLNASGGTCLFYAWTERKGYSKFGDYVGNGNANGTFVYTGFKPAWIMVKRTNSAENWYIQDDKTNILPNPALNSLMANLGNAEDTNSTGRIKDFLSNGFKLRTNDSAVNGNGDTYIYAAFA